MFELVNFRPPHEVACLVWGSPMSGAKDGGRPTLHMGGVRGKLEQWAEGFAKDKHQ